MAKILSLDIETAPNMVYTWGVYEQNIGINQIKEDGYVLCWCAKWLHEKKVISDALPNYKTHYKRNPKCDRKIAESVWHLLDEADIVVTHNGDQFDIKWLNALFIKHNLPPVSGYKSVDTKKQSKNLFRFVSNKLDYITGTLKLGRKLPHEGFGLWLGCLRGDKKSWSKMVEYCCHDVVLLEKLYLKMRPYMKSHPNMTLYSDGSGCVTCESSRLEKRGYSYTTDGKFQRYRCQSCGKFQRGKQNLAPNKERKRSI